MRGEGDLYDLVEDNIGEPLRLHVYNSQTDLVREVREHSKVYLLSVKD
jgi:hypothetical protein